MYTVMLEHVTLCFHVTMQLNVDQGKTSYISLWCELQFVIIVYILPSWSHWVCWTVCHPLYLRLGHVCHPLYLRLGHVCHPLYLRLGHVYHPLYLRLGHVCHPLYLRLCHIPQVRRDLWQSSHKHGRNSSRQGTRSKPQNSLTNCTCIIIFMQYTKLTT